MQIFDLFKVIRVSSDTVVWAAQWDLGLSYYG